MRKQRATAKKQKTIPYGKPLFYACWVLIALLVAGLLVYYLLASKRVAGGFGLPLDDGWIHARFAQNIARGLGFSFNPGELTSTTTSPLWTLLLAAGYRITGEYFISGLFINYLLCLFLLFLVYKLTIVFFPSQWLGLSVAVVTALTVPLPWWVLSGMEPVLYALLALLGILFHLRWGKGTGWRGLAPTTIFSLAAVARPEMLLLFPLSMLDRLIVYLLEKRAHAGRRWLKELAIHTAIFLIIISPVFLYNLHVTGFLLPTSYYSKLQRIGLSGALVDPRITWFAALLEGPAYELRDIFVVWAQNNCLLIMPFLLAFAWLIRQSFLKVTAEPRSFLIPMLILIQPIAWAIIGGYRPPDFQSQRYLANLNPLYLFLGMFGGWLITEFLPVLRRPGLRGALLVVIILTSLLRQPDYAKTYALNVKNTNDMQVRIAHWLKDNTPPDALVVVNDIGAIGYISHRRVLDLQGLITPEILPLRDMEHRLEGTAPQAIFDFLSARQPDYLVIFPSWYPDLANRSDIFTPVYWVEIEDNITNGAPLMVVYRAEWDSLL